MKNINLTLLVISLSLAIGCDNSKPISETPYIEVSGVITTDTTWDAAHSPYIVTGDVIVERGATLIIEPKVEVRFDGFYGLIVRGVLIADGISNDQSITFTSNSSQPDVEDWKSIYFDNTNDDVSKLKYAKIEYAKTAIDVFASSPQITDCTLTHNHTAIYISNMLSKISYNLVSDNLQGIVVKQRMLRAISNNVVTRNVNGIICYSPLVLRQNNLSGNLEFALAVKYSRNVSSPHPSLNVDGRYNWWGIANENLIEEQIHDIHDNSELVEVLYIPFSTSHIANAGPR